MAKIRSLKQYNKKYKSCKSSLIQFTKKELEEQAKINNCSIEFLLKGKKWVKIGNYYLELPRFFSGLWFKSLGLGIKLASGTILAGGAAAGIAIPVVIRANMLIVDKHVLFNDDKSTFEDLPDLTETQKKSIKKDLTVDVKDEKNGDKKYILSFKSESIATKVEVVGVVSVNINDAVLKEGTDYEVVNKGADDIYVIVYKSALQAHGEDVKITPKISTYVIRHNVTIDAQNDTSPVILKYKKGNKVEHPKDPTYVGYDFNGWFTESTGGEEYNFDNPVNEDFTIYGQWEAHTYNISTTNVEHVTSYSVASEAAYKSDVTVSATSDEGYDITNLVVKQNDTIIKTIEGSSGSFTMPAGDVTITATVELHEYSITYQNVTESEHTNPTTYNIESSEITLLDATREGWDFGGWYSDEGFETPITSIPQGTTGDKVIYAKMIQHEYAVTFDVQGHGTAPSSQSILHGEKVIRPEDPTETGYTFAGWFKEAGCENEWDFDNDIVTQATTLYAKWDINKYDVTFDVQGHGTAPATQQVEYEGKVTKPEDPSETGYTFGGWFKESECANAWNFESDTITGTTTLYAKWTINSYSIAVSAGTGGTATGSGTYDHGSSCTIIATPNPGYDFKEWQENGTKVEGATAEYTFTVESARSFEAIFEAQPHSITVSSVEHLTISTNPQSTAVTDQEVIVTTQVDPSYVVKTLQYKYNDGTQEHVEDITDGKFNMPAYDVTVTGSVDVTSYEITATSEDESKGTVTGGGTYSPNQEVTLKATPAEGYHFDGWYENDVKVQGADAEYKFNATSNRTLVAKFVINTYTITVTKTGEGTVTGDGDYQHGTTVNLTATPGTGYSFEGWYENSTLQSSSEEYSFSATSARTLEARFKINTYTITVNKTGEGTVTGAGNYNHGAQVTLTATPDTGYHFVGWYEDSTEQSTSATYQFEATSNRTLEARFAINTYTITLTADTGGTIKSGAGTYDYGQSCTAVAEASSSYVFDGWYENSSKVSSDASYTFTVNSARTLVAKFKKTVSIIYSSDDEIDRRGTVSGPTETVYEGDSVTLTATPKDSRTFLGWYSGSTQVSSSASYTFTASTDVNLVAKFSNHQFNYAIENNVIDVPISENATNGDTIYMAGWNGSSCTKMMLWDDYTNIVSLLDVSDYENILVIVDNEEFPCAVQADGTLTSCSTKYVDYFPAGDYKIKIPLKNQYSSICKEKNIRFLSGS